MIQNQMNHRKWINNLINRNSEEEIKKQRALQREGQGNHRQDESRPTLESLLSEGYDTVIWDASNSMHGICREVHDQQWALEDFISGLEHDAPIFEKTHPGDANCFLVVTGPDLPPVTVDSYGNVGNV